jgi:hypothetical protein
MMFTSLSTSVGAPNRSSRRWATERLLEPLQHAVRPLRDLDVLGVLGQDLAAQVGHRDPGVRRPEVAGQRDAGPLVEHEVHRATTAGRLAVVDLADELVTEQEVHALGDRRPGDTGQAAEVGARAGLTAADQLEQAAGARVSSAWPRGLGGRGLAGGGRRSRGRHGGKDR